MTQETQAPSPRRASTWRRVCLLALVVAALLVTTVQSAYAAPNSITQPDIGGQYTSLQLDGAGFPVISHYDLATSKLKVVHCGDVNCASSNTITMPDGMAVAVAGIAHTSLALAGGVPVVTHYDSGPKDLKFVHCGNALCSAPTVRTLDSNPMNPNENVGIYASVAINGSGNPVVAYYYEPFDILKVLVCNNPTCSSYTDQMVDATAITGLYPSLVLDASGFPVISYYDQSDTALNLVHCSDAACIAKVTTTVDGTGTDVGKYSSIALDALGFPVISYYNEMNGDLKVVHCGDATCMTSNTITTPDSANNVGQFTSLRLDDTGNPVVSYYDVTMTALKVLHCGNATCMAGNTFVAPDSDGTVGQYTSLALDATGHPVVSYYDATDSKLNVLHCGDPLCVGSPAGVGGVTQLTGISEGSASGETSAFWWLTGGVVLVAALVVAARWRRGSAEG